MKYSAALCLALFPFTLTGCVTVHNSKSLVVTPEPGAAKAMVIADASARCYDFILVSWCKLDLALRQVGGRTANGPQAKKIREFISANYEELVDDLSSGSGRSLSTLLDLLQIPAQRHVEAILQMKGLHAQAKQSAPDFAALVIDRLFKSA